MTSYPYLAPLLGPCTCLLTGHSPRSESVSVTLLNGHSIETDGFSIHTQKMVIDVETPKLRVQALLAIFITHSPSPKGQGSFGRIDRNIVQAGGGAQLKYKRIFSGHSRSVTHMKFITVETACTTCAHYKAR